VVQVMAWRLLLDVVTQISSTGRGTGRTTVAYMPTHVYSAAHTIAADFGTKGPPVCGLYTVQAADTHACFVNPQRSCCTLRSPAERSHGCHAVHSPLALAFMAASAPVTAAAALHSFLCPAFQAARWWSTPQYQAALQRPQHSSSAGDAPHQAHARAAASMCGGAAVP
jgi:hypothetical protein